MKNLRLLLLLSLIAVCSFVNPVSAQTTDTNDTTIMPSYPGGLDSLYTQIEENFLISRTDVVHDMGEEYVANLSLTINKKGEVIFVQGVSGSVGYELERALMEVDNWIPASKDGKNITSYVDIKFTYYIKGNRIEIVDHLSVIYRVRSKNYNWLKTLLAAVAITGFLLVVY